MQKCSVVCRLSAKDDCAGCITRSGRALLWRFSAQVKPHEGVVLMTRAWLFTLASYLVVAAGVTAKGDEPPVPDRANEQGAGQPAAASTFGSIRRTGIAQQVEPGSQSGPGTRAGQTSKTGSPAASAPMPAARQKDTTALPTERRVTIPPPPLFGHRSESSRYVELGRENSTGTGSTWRHRHDCHSLIEHGCKHDSTSKTASQ